MPPKPIYPPPIPTPPKDLGSQNIILIRDYKIDPNVILNMMAPYGKNNFVKATEHFNIPPCEFYLAIFEKKVAMRKCFKELEKCGKLFRIEKLVEMR